MKLPFIQQEAKNRDEIVKIPIKKVLPNPYQPRKEFNLEEIKELAQSIENYGVIQAIIVKKEEDNYILIAGERRLRASQFLNLEYIPAVIKDFSAKEMAEIALVENLQRKDLDFMEEADAYQKIIEMFNMTQKELAAKIGKSQSSIANKLRLLRLDTDIRKHLTGEEFTERHARALLKLAEKELQLTVINKIKEEKLTVKDTEKFIHKLLETKQKKKPVKTVYKDYRLFTNTLNKFLEEMKTAGLDVKVNQEKKADFVEYVIRLPRN